MRGNDEQQTTVFSYINPEERIPQEHPLRRIRQMTDTALGQMSPHFAALYARQGRPSIPPERLLRALLLQILYSIRGEALLMEQINYNLLFRWFVGLNPDDEVWHATVFCKNRDRLLAGEVSQRLLEAVLEQAAGRQLLSDEHFTVDGTLIAAWASRRSFVPKDPPPTQGTGGRGRKLLRDTHESKTDPQADEERQHPGFARSQQKRELVERIFGWGKLDSILRQVKLRGEAKVDWLFCLLATAANLVRMVKLIPAV
jgi:transposase